MTTGTRRRTRSTRSVRVASRSSARPRSSSSDYCITCLPPVDSARRLLYFESWTCCTRPNWQTTMDDKLQVLENVPLLASLGEELMKNLAESAEFIAVKKGDLVVRENDPGDALYAVGSGRLQAYTRLKSGRERVFATYCNGDCFGEMPLLSGETQWASVRALNDSVLLKIPRDGFNAIVNRDPRVAVSFMQRMGHRIKELREEKHRAKWSTIIALYSAVPGAGKTLLATNLVASLGKKTGEPVLLLDFSGRQNSVSLVSCGRLSSHNGSGLDSLLVHHPLGYDRPNLPLVGAETEPPLNGPLFGFLQ